MSDRNAATAAGLRITGDVHTGPPPARTSYARAAYANTAPDATKATWLVVHADGTATAYAGKVEYGQGIRTGLAIEVADELRLPVAAVEVVLGDTELVPWDMGTFGSQSTARVGLQLRKAAATAREALLELAADRFDLPAGGLRAEAGRVKADGDGGRSATYAELLAGQSVERELADDVALMPPAGFTQMARPQRRIDADARVTGAAVYARDVMVDGMLFAAVLRWPAAGARLRDVDTSTAERMPGVARVVRDGHLVGVLADSDEHAAAGVAVLRAQWDEPGESPATPVDLPALLVESGRDPYVTQEAGAPEDAFRGAAGVLEATYFIPYVSNAPMEPRAAVARWDGDRLTVWAGTQRPFGIRSELAQRFGIEESAVRVIAPEIGGGFGSKSPYPVAHEAARLARIAGCPVRVAYTRAEDMAYATFRPAALITIKSGFMSDGKLVAWRFEGYHAGDRPFLGRRGSETPYDVPHVKVTTYTSDSPLPTGSYRSLGAAVNHFARESHMDEIAAAVGIDTVELRLRNLSDARFRRVLERAAAAHGWSAEAPPSKRGQGVAIGIDVGSYCATVAQLDVQGSEVRVERVTAALDCGLTVNPDGARNQVEGSVVMGMGTALYEAIDFRGGRVLNAGFTRYRVPRSSDAPAVQVELVGDDDTPSTGAGEPGIVPIAAAIANAVFDRTGTRLRELPLQRVLR
ncbi:MAG: xanthine dehydrogenase family protein molybdopterin-binding subunit [Dehalococcoidia bacterium]|nr:xanthine dehydrogenase family protein molybdopterin-binding subunit [Dehalococcoidia bacterium]